MVEIAYGLNIGALVRNGKELESFFRRSLPDAASYMVSLHPNAVFISGNVGIFEKSAASICSIVYL